MRSGSRRVSLAGSESPTEADEAKLLEYGNTMVNRGEASFYAIFWSASSEPMLEVTWKKYPAATYRVAKTVFGDKILDVATGANAPDAGSWVPNLFKVIDFGGDQLKVESVGAQAKPEDVVKTGDKGDGVGAPGGRNGLLTWAPRGWPADISEYLKWALILGAVGVGVLVLDFVTKD
jgi:hypothetical protein